MRSSGCGHLGVGEGPHHVHEGVDLAQLPQGGPAEALTGSGAGGQPGDVHHLHLGRHAARDVLRVGDGVEAGVRARRPSRGPARGW